MDILGVGVFKEIGRDTFVKCSEKRVRWSCTRTAPDSMAAVVGRGP